MWGKIMIPMYRLWQEPCYGFLVVITRLIWTIWTSLSAVPRKAIKFNHSLTSIVQACIPLPMHSLIAIHFYQWHQMFLLSATNGIGGDLGMVHACFHPWPSVHHNPHSLLTFDHSLLNVHGFPFCGLSSSLCAFADKLLIWLTSNLLGDSFCLDFPGLMGLTRTDKLLLTLCWILIQICPLSN